MIRTLISMAVESDDRSDDVLPNLVSFLDYASAAAIARVDGASGGVDRGRARHRVRWHEQATTENGCAQVMHERADGCAPQCSRITSCARVASRGALSS